MLSDLGQNDVADRIRHAIDEVFKEGKFLTPDLNGSASTAEFVTEIKRKIQ